MRRICLQGYVYHLFTKAAAGRRLLRDESDGRDLVERLQTCVSCAGMTLYAWCITPERLHLLGRAGEAPIPFFMRRLLSGYARSLNRRSGAEGSLFAGRYSSIVIEESRYLLDLVRDIHLLPLQEGRVENLDGLRGWRWSGHRALLGLERCDWLDTRLVTDLLRQRALGGTDYDSFVRQATSEPGFWSGIGGGGFTRSSGLAALLPGHDPRTLGSRRFTERVLREAKGATDAEEGCAESAERGIEYLVAQTTKRLRITVEQLRSSSRRRCVSAARSLICHLAVQTLGMTYREISEYVGIGPSAVAKAAERATTILKAYPEISSSLTRFMSQSRK